MGGRQGRRLWLLALVASLAAGIAWAVVVVQEGALRFQDDSGQPIPKATVTIDFGGATLEAETDDDGEVPLLLLPSRPEAGEDADDDGFVLIGDGPGRIHYPGGPAEGVPFTVRGGALVLDGPAARQGPNRALLIGGGAILVGGLAAIAGGGDGAESPPVTSPGGTVTTTPTPTPTPTPEPQPERTGAFATLFALLENLADHPNLLAQMTTVRIDAIKAVGALDSPARVTADDPDFIPVEGTLEDAGRLVASGAGTYAGFDTTATLEITFNGADAFSGRYSIGTDGALPGGQPITWSVTGSR